MKLLYRFFKAILLFLFSLSVLCCLALLAGKYTIVSLFVGALAPYWVLVGLTSGLSSISILGWSWMHRTKNRKMILTVAAGGGVLALIAFAIEWFSYPTTTIHFRQGDVVLAGDLYLPENGGRHPVVVLGHGSMMIPNRFYRYWGDRFMQAGYAVFIYDKRGTGRSGGARPLNNATRKHLHLLAADMQAGIQAVSKHANIDSTQVWVYGISQAGWVVPIVAARHSILAGMVLNSGPVCSTDEESYYSYLTGDDHGDASKVLSTAQIADSLKSFAPKGMRTDSVLVHVKTPGLWLFGGADKSIPTALSIKRLQAVSDSFQLQQKYILFENANHVLFLHDGLWRYEVPGAMDSTLSWMASQARHK